MFYSFLTAAKETQNGQWEAHSEVLVMRQKVVHLDETNWYQKLEVHKLGDKCSRCVHLLFFALAGQQYFYPNRILLSHYSDLEQQRED